MILNLLNLTWIYRVFSVTVWVLKQKFCFLYLHLWQKKQISFVLVLNCFECSLNFHKTFIKQIRCQSETILLSQSIGFVFIILSELRFFFFFLFTNFKSNSYGYLTNKPQNHWRNFWKYLSCWQTMAQFFPRMIQHGPGQQIVCTKYLNVTRVYWRAKKSMTGKLLSASILIFKPKHFRLVAAICNFNFFCYWPKNIYITTQKF